ncbi:MAG: FCSD flavin-binding domain-containing protein, partial [Burkholderiales bacterium]
QTVALRRQLEAMRDGGVFALTIPKAPYRCPPGPYERACQVAWYFKTHKPRSKVLILDANEDVVSKKALFTKIWAERYPGIVEYRPNSELVGVDVGTLTARLTFDDVKADVLNIIPPQRAGNIARDAGLITVNNKWCGVDFLTYESLALKNVHVLGDAIMAAPLMPKSGHMANQHAKVCAAAIVALLHGEEVNAQPLLTNTCYSFVSDKDVIHVASVHAYNPDKKTMEVVSGASGVSTEANELEGHYAEAWGRNIWADMLG